MDSSIVTSPRMGAPELVKSPSYWRYYQVMSPAKRYFFYKWYLRIPVVIMANAIGTNTQYANLIAKDLGLRKDDGLKRGTKSKAYVSWMGMKGRCLCPTNNKYYRYGARGIKVCDRWLIFQNFLDDMGQPLRNTPFTALITTVTTSHQIADGQTIKHRGEYTEFITEIFAGTVANERLR